MCFYFSLLLFFFLGERRLRNNIVVQDQHVELETAKLVCSHLSGNTHIYNASNVQQNSFALEFLFAGIVRLGCLLSVVVAVCVDR